MSNESHKCYTTTDILQEVKARAKRPYLMGIDGHSGAGKSTLARKLSNFLVDAVVVHNDDFYRVMDETARATLNPEQGYNQYFDWERLEHQVLRPLSNGQIVSYQRYDWGEGELAETIEVAPMNIVIVEGVYSTRPELFDYYDLCVWVETSEAERLRRQDARSANSNVWIQRWASAEMFYVKHFRPDLSKYMTIQGEG